MSCATARPSTIQLKLAKAIGWPVGGGLVSPDRTPLCGFSLASVREGPKVRRHRATALRLRPLVTYQPGRVKEGPRARWLQALRHCNNDEIQGRTAPGSSLPVAPFPRCPDLDTGQA